MDQRTRWRRARARAVSPIIATLFTVGLAVALGVILWTFKFALPAKPVAVEYTAQSGLTEPAWGDPTDCGGSTGINAHCDLLPAFAIVFTSHSPDLLLLSSLQFLMVCNGTSLLNGTFNQLEIIPGSGANPAAGAPALGKCGTWKPSTGGNQATYFNRLAYFQQVYPGSTIMHDGDQFVVYEHPSTVFCDSEGICPDDDYHGAPPWCFTIVGDCHIDISYVQTPATLIANIPMWELRGY